MDPQPEKKGGFLEKAWAWQHRVDDRIAGITTGRIARVLKMARKPEPEEFRQSALVVLVGIAIIGAFGFFVLLFMEWLLGQNMLKIV